MDEKQGTPSGPTQGGNPADPSAQAGGGDQGAQPQFLTAETLPDAMKPVLEQFGKQLLGEATSRAQSLVDKTDHRITETIRQKMGQVDEFVKLAEQSGIQYTPEQVRQMKANAQSAVLAGDGLEAKGDQEQPPTSQGAEPEPAAPGPGGSWMDQALFALQSEKGVFLTDADPELAEVPQDAKSFGELYSAVEKAIEKKAKRLAGVQDEDADHPEETPEERRARLAAQQPGGGGGSGHRPSAPSPDKIDTVDRFSRAYSQGK